MMMTGSASSGVPYYEDATPEDFADDDWLGCEDVIDPPTRSTAPPEVWKEIDAELDRMAESLRELLDARLAEKQRKKAGDGD